MRDMLNRPFTVGDQVAYVVRGSVRVRAVIGVVREANVVDDTVRLEVLKSINPDDVGRMTASIRERNVLLLKDVQ